MTSQKFHIAYLLTGSNIGNSSARLEEACRLVEINAGKVQRKSAVYKTEPWGNKDQQPFYNQVLEVNTELSPEALLRQILEIEQKMGRTREKKWEPRIIDIDILFYNSLVLDSPGLVIPHPLLHARRFTLVPMAELTPQFIHPAFDKTISKLLETCTDNGVVEKL